MLIQAFWSVVHGIRAVRLGFQFVEVSGYRCLIGSALPYWDRSSGSPLLGCSG